MSNAEDQARYRAKHPERSRELVRISIMKARFGGNRETVLKRDSYTCTKCGMTDSQHKEKFGRSITIDHIDNQGRYSPIKNNALNNLTTLCLPCHGRKDALVRWRRNYE